MNASRALSPFAALTAFGLLFAAFPVGCSALPPSATSTVLPAKEVTHAAPPVHAEAALRSKPAPAIQRHRFAVATENPTATRVAMGALERGGSAADAAIAGMLSIGVTHPVSSGIGGGGFALVWDAKTRKVTALDFREAAPIGIRPSDYLVRPPPEGKRGVMVGVPGEIAGFAELHARWGRLAFADVVRGAAEAAENGFPLSPHMARALKWNAKWVLSAPRYDLFHPAGALVAAGAVVKNPALAATLRRIGAEGKEAFYEGAIAADVLATARAANSPMTPGDLSKYKVIEREPLATSWEGYDVYTMPPPSAGGLMMLEALRMHTKADLTALGFGTGAYLHVLAETFRGALADRLRFVGDPAFVKADVAALAAPARMKARRARIRLDATTQAEAFPVKEAGTNHLVVVDGEGNVVSATSTVNNMFGAKLVTQGGFVLNDGLDDFTTDKIARRFGARTGPNAPRGGARPVSSMTPTIVLREQQPVLGLGGSGGMRIPTGTTQVLLAHLAFGRSVGQAIEDPRIETPPTGGLLLDAAAPAEVVEDLQKRGEVVDTTKPNFSAIQAISIDYAGGGRTIRAVADPRKGGAGEVD